MNAKMLMFFLLISFNGYSQDDHILALIPRNTVAAFSQSVLSSKLKLLTSENDLEIISTSYCGAINRDTGKLIIYASTSPKGGMSIPNTTVLNCEDPLESLASLAVCRIDSLDSIYAIEAEIYWQNWDIRFIAKKMVVAYKNVDEVFSDDITISQDTLFSTKTNNIAFEASNRITLFDVGLAFGEAGAVVSASQPGLPVPTPNSEGEISLLAFDVNQLSTVGAVFYLPLDWVNNEMSYNEIKFPIHNENVIVYQPNATIKENQIILSGKVKPFQLQRYIEFRIFLDKSTFIYRSIELTAEKQKCYGSQEEVLKCNIDNFKAGAFATYATAEIDRKNFGRSFQPVSREQTSFITVNDVRFMCRLESKAGYGLSSAIILLAELFIENAN